MCDWYLNYAIKFVITNQLKVVLNMKNFCVLLVLLCSAFMFAQKKTVNGKVSDGQGLPLPGVNILVQGTNTGKQSDFDGNYSINVSEGQVLEFSYLGFKTKTVIVVKQQTINVSLEESSSHLDEVVVVGYGTQSKKDITGSVATVKGEAITQRSSTNISTALQGAVAGVTVTRSTSSPGSGSTIRIRGNTTLQGSNDPLILVDDVPVSSIDVVPADQVESITVLKDGAAAAIYGSRGAAGVIIVTTKRAKTGVLTASYGGEYFVNTPSEKRELVDPARYMEIINEMRWNDNSNISGGNFPVYNLATINAYKSKQYLVDRDAYPYTDWNKLLIKNQATGVRHNVNVSGGSEKVKTNFSLGYENQDALYALREWTRYTGRLNNDIKINKRIGVTSDVAFRIVESDNPIIDPTGNITNAPIYNAFHQDGRLAGGRNNGNSYGRLHSGSFSNSNSYNLSAKIGVYVKPINDLKITLNFAPNFSFSETKTWSKPQPYWAFDDPNQVQAPQMIFQVLEASLGESRSNTNTFTKQAFINYDKVFGDHTIGLVAGYEDFTSKTENLNVRGDKFLSADFPYLSQAPADRVFDNGSSVGEIAYVSGFGRLNYNYGEKYYISGSVRRDGSSRFASDYRWGSFPSVSAAWTVSNEEFMKSLKTPLSFLKLKASYGSLGNDRLGNYLYLTLLQVAPVLIDQGGSAQEVRALSQRYLTTPDIRWETTTTKNFGADIGFFNSRLSLEGEYYIKKTEDMLLSLSVPNLVGFDDPTVNVGTMETKGWSASVSWKDTVGENFKYDATFFMFDDKSIIGEINGKRLFDGNTLSEAGSEFRGLYGYVSDGIYQTKEEIINSPVTSSVVKPGDVRYKDINGPNGVPDGVINSFDRQFLGSSLDHYTYGGQLNMNYKGLDFGLTFQGVAKNNFVFTRDLILPNPEVENQTKEFDGNFWSVYNTPQQNLDAKYPRMSIVSNSNNYRFSDYWLMDGSYLKIKSLTLGYSLSQDAVNRTPFSKVRLYATGTDLFRFDNLPKGVDPEQTNGSSYYLTKTAVFGIQLNF